MISVNQVTKKYDVVMKTGRFRKTVVPKIAVQGLSFELRPGEIIGLLGLNGAGKTTTIKMLSTLLEPTSGSIHVDGLDIIKDRRHIQGIINMIAGGERMLYWRLTGRENLHYFGRLYGLNETLVRERTETLLREVGLQEAGNQPVEQYSKGMKQRLQIARELMNDPKYLFLDEPTLGLDAPIARQLRQLVRSLAVKSGKGILLTSHYLQEVEELCDRVYILDRGQLIVEDTPQAVAKQVAADEQVHILVDRCTETLAEELRLRFAAGKEGSLIISPDDTGSIAIVILTKSADDIVPDLLQRLVREDVRIRSVDIRKPTLEDAIIALSKREETEDTELTG